MLSGYIAGDHLSHELYGFLVKDIAGLIEQDCRRCSDSDGVGGTGSHVTVDTARRYQLVYRYSYIRHSLRPFGYDFDVHPQFAARLVRSTCCSASVSFPSLSSSFSSLSVYVRDELLPTLSGSWTELISLNVAHSSLCYSLIHADPYSHNNEGDGTIESVISR